MIFDNRSAFKFLLLNYLTHYLAHSAWISQQCEIVCSVSLLKNWHKVDKLNETIFFFYHLWTKNIRFLTNYALMFGFFL